MSKAASGRAAPSDSSWICVNRSERGVELVMSQKTILVADDESHILSVVSLKLRNAGFNVLTAVDGQEALDLALSEKPHLLITDYHMPAFSGIEVCQRLRQAGSKIPA